MAVILDLDDLDQGGLTSPTDAVWGTPTGREVAITSAGEIVDPVDIKLVDTTIIIEVNE